MITGYLKTRVIFKSNGGKLYYQCDLYVMNVVKITGIPTKTVHIHCKPVFLTSYFFVRLCLYVKRNRKFVLNSLN